MSHNVSETDSACNLLFPVRFGCECVNFKRSMGIHILNIQENITMWLMSNDFVDDNLTTIHYPNQC